MASAAAAAGAERSAKGTFYHGVPIVSYLMPDSVFKAWKQKKCLRN